MHCIHPKGSASNTSLQDSRSIIDVTIATSTKKSAMKQDGTAMIVGYTFAIMVEMMNAFSNTIYNMDQHVVNKISRAI